MTCSSTADRLKQAGKPSGCASENASGFEEWPAQFEGRFVRICIRDLLAARGGNQNQVSYRWEMNDCITGEKWNVTEKLDERQKIL
jgi:hypothetical protein